MSMQQNMNQVTQSPMKGDVSHLVTPATISVSIDPASSLNSVAPLYAGDMVALSDTTAGNVILVDKALANSTMFGVALYVPKKDQFVAGDALEVGMAGTVVYMESTNSIARGASVEYVPATTTVQTKASGTAIGYALDKATASGQLIRVKLV